MALPQGRRIEPARIEPAVSTIGRLKRRSDFLAAAGGRRFHTEHMTAQGRLRDDATGSVTVSDGLLCDGLRIGFTITKRVGHATERNRIRRRLRDAVARSGIDLPAAKADVVLVARRPALHAPFATLIADLHRAVGIVTKPKGADPGASHGKRRSGKNRAQPSGDWSAPPASPGRDPATGAASLGPADLSPSPNTRDGSLDG